MTATWDLWRMLLALIGRVEARGNTWHHMNAEDLC